MSINPVKTSADFTFKNVGQPDKLGQSYSTVAEFQTDLDSRAIDNMTEINNIKTTLASQSSGDSGADNVYRYNGDGGGDTVQDALTTLIAAGSGTVPPDGTITNAKLAIDVKVGSLGDLDTTYTDDVVGAINEVNTAVSAVQFPTGAVIPFAGESGSVPSGWYLCDGTAKSRAAESTLFAVIGETYGAGDGATTFNLPNLQGKIPVGYSSGETEFDALAKTGGEKTITLTSSEIPAHTHTVNHDHGAITSGNQSSSHTHSFNAGSATTGLATTTTSTTSYGLNYASGGAYKSVLIASTSTSHSHSFNPPAGTTGTNSVSHTHTTTIPAYSGSSGSAGSGGAHNNLQPYISLNYIIKN